MGVEACYNEAVALEKEVAQMYREIRAARLSQIQSQSLRKSMDQVLLPISNRIHADGAVLEAEARTAADIARYQEELKKVMQETDAMVGNAEEMLRALLPEQREEEAEEETNPEQIEDSKSSGEERAADPSGRHIAQQQALAAQSQAAAGNVLDISDQMKGFNLNAAPEPVSPGDLPPSIKKYISGVSGRKLVTQGGTPTVWVAVNQWYILGPYDNHGRMNRQRVYPPESIIDLNANYPGKNGALLQWNYDSFAEAQVNPSTGQSEYSIYYGWTELFFEEAADLWIAVGSDDRSDLWINDMPVWQSSNKLKVWTIDEGLRKVHFKQGINKVVFRLENGWNLMGFSLLINTHNPERTE